MQNKGNMGVIYVRPNLINGKKYVGRAVDLVKRQGNWKNLKQPYAGRAINRAREKYGINNFGFEILKECNDDELDYWEMYFIKELNTKVPYGYNMTDGGNSGCPQSEETKRKRAEKLKGRKHTEESKRKMSAALKGRKLTEEQKKHLSELNKGRHHSKETRRKMSETRKGRKLPPLSEETRKKLSESHKGKNKGIYNTKHSKSLLQYDLNGNFIKEWPSTMEVERQMNFKNTAISACCLGKTKTAYGYKWKYAS